MIQIEPFLLGMTTMASLVASLFFLKFWWGSRDSLFLAFAAFFLLDGVERIVLILFFPKPGEGSPWIYMIRLVALLGVVAAILGKNYGRQAK